MAHNPILSNADTAVVSRLDFVDKMDRLSNAISGNPANRYLKMIYHGYFWCIYATVALIALTRISEDYHRNFFWWMLIMAVYAGTIGITAYMVELVADSRVVFYDVAILLTDATFFTCFSIAEGLIVNGIAGDNGTLDELKIRWTLWRLDLASIYLLWSIAMHKRKRFGDVLSTLKATTIFRSSRTTPKNKGR